MQEENDANNVSSNKEPTTISDFEECQNINSDDLDTPQGSEDEYDDKFPKFKMFDCGDTLRLEIIMTFTTKQFIRDVIKTYAMERRKLALQEK